MHDIVTFLRGFPPFDRADEKDLQNLVESITIEYFPEGSMLLQSETQSVDSAYVIRSGQVELLDGAVVVDAIGPGDLVGVPALLGDTSPRLSSRAAEDVLAYRVPADGLVELLSDRSGLGFVARLVRARVPDSSGVIAGADSTAASVGSCCRPAVSVAPSTPLREVIARMQAGRTSSALVTQPDNSWGILTDRDLRDRALAAGVDLDAPAHQVATYPARTIDPMMPISQAILEMLSRGIHHLPVVSPDGALVGIVEDLDLLNAQSHTPLALRRAIAHADTPQALAELSSQILLAATEAQRSGRAAPEVTALISLLTDAVTERALHLHERLLGPAPAPFAWACTGSVARGEAVLSSDVDNLLVWDGDDRDPVIRNWMRRLASDVIATLESCGLTHDEHGVRADDPRFSRSADAWLEAIAAWSRDPSANQGDIYLATLADVRAITGESLVEPMLDAVRDSLHTPLVRSAMQRAAVSHRPPTGFIRDFVIDSTGERQGTLDVKTGGTKIITDIARATVAVTGTRSVGTRQRLWFAADAGVLTPHDAEDLVDAFEFLQTLRLDHQLAQLGSGEQPDDFLSPGELSGLNRRHLRDAFRVIARVQGKLPGITRRPPA